MDEAASFPSIPQNATCVRCGYSLYQLTLDRCPECGKEFDRRVPRSMGIRPLRIQRLINRLARPTPLFTSCMPVMATLLIAVGSRLPGIIKFENMLAGVIWMAFVLLHVPLVLTRYIFFRFGLLQPKQLSVDRKMHRRSVICLIVSATLVFVPIPAICFFWLYQGDFKYLSVQVDEFPMDYPVTPPAALGPNSIVNIRRFPEGMVFVINERWHGPADWMPRERYPIHGGYILETDYGNGDRSYRRGLPLGGDWYLSFW